MKIPATIFTWNDPANLPNFLFVNLGEDSWRWMLGIMVVPAGFLPFFFVRFRKARDGLY